LQPGLGLRAGAFGATTIAAGVLAIMLLATVITRQQGPSQDFRATVAKVVDRPPMTGEQLRPEPVQVSPALARKDRRSRRHGRSRRA
jgi:hypothetical protein